MYVRTTVEVPAPSDANLTRTSATALCATIAGGMAKSLEAGDTIDIGRRVGRSVDGAPYRSRRQGIASRSEHGGRSRR